MIPEAAVEAAVEVLWDKEVSARDVRKALEAAAPHMLAAALEEAADEADGIIARGDIAECAAPVDGESGRYEAVAARDSLYEEPSHWLRARAAEMRK